MTDDRIMLVFQNKRTASKFSKIFKVILYSYLILKKMNESIIDS